MVGQVVLALLLATPFSARECKRDVLFALDEVEQHCGRFFDLKDIEWLRVRREMLRDVRRVRSDQDEFDLLCRLVARLRDGHAHVRVLPAAAEGTGWPDRGEWRGPGVFLCDGEEHVLVKNAWGDAARAGVTPGMRVVEIDGQRVDRWIDARIAELRETHSFSTDQQARFFLFHWGLAGPAGSTLPLELRAPDGDRKKITLGRGSGYVPWGPAVFPEGVERTGRQAYGRTAAGFGYIHLRDVKGALPGQLDTMLAALGDAPGLILDCRANGGGGCDHDAVFGRFVPGGETWRHGKAYRSTGAHPYAGPMVVIVDAGVRSAGETVAGMFKEDGRAYMIGPAPTAGMSSSKRTIELPSGKFALYVSVRSNMGRFNEGRGIEGIGVPPHETVRYDPEDLAQGVDTLIRRAEELLAGDLPPAVPYRPERR